MNTNHAQVTRRRIASLSVVAAMVVMLTAAGSSFAVPPTYSENFTTRAYCDTTLTTTWWDTATGQLRHYAFQAGIVGNVDPGGVSQALDIAGDYAYIADDVGSGLRIVSIADPANPVLVGQCITPGNPYGVDVTGGLAYVADNQRLAIVDIRNPAAPVLLGSTPTYPSGGARDVVVAGDYAYVAFGSYGLVVVDVTVSASPQVVGTYNTPGTAAGVYLSGNIAYVADGSTGLYILDITNPLSPTLLGSLDTPGNANDVEVHGDHAYVADGLLGLVVVDVSTPTSPVLVGHYDTTGSAIGVNVAGDYAFVAAYTEGVMMFDVSNPSNPVPVWTIPLGAGNNAYDVIADGTYAFAAAMGGGLFCLEVGAAVTPPQKLTNTPSVYGELYIDGDYMYSLISLYFRVYDVSDLANPLLLGSTRLSGLVDFDIDGDHAYLAATNVGVIVLDLSDLTAPAPVETLMTTQSSPVAVDVNGDYGYVALNSQGIDVINVQDPANPVLVNNVVATSGLQDLVISGDYLYVLGSDYYIYDITSPTVPTLVGTVAITSNVVAMALYGRQALLASSSLGFHVVDSYPPASLRYTQSLYGNSVAVCDRRAFFGGFQSGLLTVFDISTPTSPVTVGETNGTGSQMSIWGDFLLTDFGMHRVTDRLYYSGQNVAQSRSLNTQDVTIVSATVSPTQEGDVLWMLSADGGTHWRITTPGYLTDFPFPGSDLRWYAALNRVALGTPTTVSDLTVTWFCEEPVITSVVDIPNDQGRQVRVSWQRSGYDYFDTTILQYAIYRRWDPSPGGVAMPVESVQTGPRPGPLAALPPGEWDFITTIPATSEDNYSVVVPTVADSTITNGMYRSVFFVSAMTGTPAVHYDSPADSGYSVDNLAPTPPQNLVVVENTGGGNTLTWDECPDGDFQYFRIYRGDDPNFVPGPGNLVDVTTATGWSDPAFDGWNRIYKMTAMDYSGNESAPSSPITVTSVDPPDIKEFALHQNFPNPFNPITLLRYDVPRSGGHVSVHIYDAAGRSVRTLVERVEAPGHRSVTWDGLDDRGAPVASGVYFCRMTAPGYRHTVKLTLLQ